MEAFAVFDDDDDDDDPFARSNGSRRQAPNTTPKWIVNLHVAQVMQKEIADWLGTPRYVCPT